MTLLHSNPRRRLKGSAEVPFGERASAEGGCCSRTGCSAGNREGQHGPAACAGTCHAACAAQARAAGALSAAQPHGAAGANLCCCLGCPPSAGIYAERSQAGISGVAAGDLSQVRSLGGAERGPAGASGREAREAAGAAYACMPWNIRCRALSCDRFSTCVCWCRRARCASSTATAPGDPASWSGRWRRAPGSPRHAGGLGLARWSAPAVAPATAPAAAVPLLRGLASCAPRRATASHTAVVSPPAPPPCSRSMVLKHAALLRVGLWTELMGMLSGQQQEAACEL